MNTKSNANFSILGLKNAEKRLEILYIYILIFMDYNKVLFSRSTFHEKPRKKIQDVLFCRCRSKTLILAKIYTF